MNLRFRRENMQDRSNLILDIDTDMAVDSFAIYMIGRNHIDSLVALQLNQFNDKSYFRYDITGMDTLSNRLNDVWNSQEVLEFLNRIIKALEEVESYMLEVGNIYLKEDYIFLDKKNDYHFIFIPIEESLGENIIPFIHRMINKIEPDYTEKETVFFNILNAFNRGAIVKLADLKELLRKNKEEIFVDSLDMENTEGRLDANVKEDEIKSNMVWESDRKEKNSGIKLNFEIPGIINQGKEVEVPKEIKKEAKKEESKAKEKKQNSISIKNNPQSPKIGFDIPGVKKQEKEPEILEITKKNEKKAGKESFSLFGKREKFSKGVIAQEQINAENSVPNVKKEDDEMYECYEQTIILHMPQEEDTDSTVLMEEGNIRRAELVRNLNQERFEVASNTIIGVGALADYRIENNRKISRRHASIRVENSHYFIKDNNSSNGTYINGRRMIPEMEEEIKNNDIIRMADEDFVFRVR